MPRKSFQDFGTFTFLILFALSFVLSERQNVMKNIVNRSPAGRPGSTSIHKSSSKVKSSTQSSTQEREAPAEVKKGFWDFLKRDQAAKPIAAPAVKVTQSPGIFDSAHKASDVTKFRYIDARYLNARFKRAPLAGKGAAIIAIAKKNGIDPVFFAAIIAFETGWGTSSKVRDKNNPGGIFKNKRYVTFGSIEQGLESMAGSLRRVYLERKGKPLKTVGAIASVYAPVGAKNDPNRTNRLWPGVVAKNMNTIMQGSVNLKNSPNLAKKGKGDAKFL